jgi:peptidoglycan/LPS O-acetylase OafA/YrhL
MGKHRDDAVLYGALSPMLNVIRFSLIALGVACIMLAFALWYDGNGNDLSGWTILLGAVGLALIVVGAAVTPVQRPQVGRQPGRR